jgi:hypothetical protein
VRFQPDQIRRLGVAMEQELDSIIKQARYKLNQKPRAVEGSAFTTFGYALAMVHTEVIEYADQDLIGKAKASMEFNDLLQKTARNQDEADRKSIIKGGR